MNDEQFYRVSLKKTKKYNYLLITSVIGSMVIFVLSLSLASSFQNAIINSTNSVALSNIVGTVMFIIGIALIVLIWYVYIKHQKHGTKKKPSKKIIDYLEYFIDSNNLYETGVDKYGKKIISNSVLLGYYDNDNTFTIRAYKRADKFNDKMNTLDTSLSALTGLPLENKHDTIKYCDYIFNREEAERIVVNNTYSEKVVCKNTTLVPLNSSVSWNILKQPHMLIAGGTGSGKTTFINYMILEFLKITPTENLYICDPKNSDLASLKHYLGENNVASSSANIINLVKVVNGIMKGRYLQYKENAENFVYGNSYFDYGLKPVFLVFDELGAFRASADKKLFADTMQKLTEIILKGREMGVFVLLATQQPNANNIPTELRDNLSVRVALGNLSSEAYRMVFGDSCNDLESITGKGTGYLYLDGLGWEKPRYFETPYLDYKTFNFIEELKKYC